MSQSPAIQKFIAHWRSLIKDGLAPSLQDFLGLPNPLFQPFVVLLDVVSSTEVNIRLMGTGVVQLTGQELTKTNSLDMYAPHLRQQAGRNCVAMVKQPCGEMSERLVTKAGGLMTPVSRVALPLVCKTGQGCLVAFIDARESVGEGQSMSVVHEIRSSEWIDIGAGVPDHAA